jgi:hypothetical protein
MYSEGVRTGSEARAWLLKDEGLFGWGLRVTLDTADRVIAVMPFTGYGKLTPADLVDKATAWDECDKSYRRARSKALEQAAKLIEDNMLCVPNGVEGIYPRSNPGNRVGLAYAAAIRALDDTKKGSER